MKKFLTIYIENGIIKSIEHDKLGECSKWWIDNYPQFEMIGFTFGIQDEKTEGYEEALSKISDGKIQELEILKTYLLLRIELLNRKFN